MTRKLGPILMVLTLAVCASAAVNPGKISGYVKNSAGVPQMGAAVEVLASSSAQTIYTDARGFFSVAALLPGTYAVKVSAPSFLPTIRENIRLDSGATLVVNLTLNTLFEAVQILPARARTPEEHDDWKWTLRSASNRPILRVLDDGPLVIVSKSDDESDKVLKAHVAFMAGNDGSGFGGSPDMSTNFMVEHSLFNSGTLSVNGDIGYGNSIPTGVVSAAYSQRMPNGSHPTVALTARRFATVDSASRDAALQALAISLSDSAQIGSFLGLNFGSELQTVEFRGRATAFRPFGSADIHLSPDLVVEYAYASSRPTTRRYKGYDTAPADLSETDPRVALVNDAPSIERAHHHEISISRRAGKNRLQAAYYLDSIDNIVLNGVGENVFSGGDILSDVYSGTFNYGGGNMSTSGVRLVLERKLSNSLTATLDYAFGGVLTLDQTGLEWSQIRDALRNQRSHSFAAKLAGTLPVTRTRVVTSYRFSSEDALTPVDMFNASAGQADPFFNIFIRQPLPGRRFIPGNMEALVDVRNLLAQGYMPILGQDGHTLYLVQAARSFRGGLAFTF